MYIYLHIQICKYPFGAKSKWKLWNILNLIIFELYLHLSYRFGTQWNSVFVPKCQTSKSEYFSLRRFFYFFQSDLIFPEQNEHLVSKQTGKTYIVCPRGWLLLAYTEKTIFPFPFTLNGIWSGWQFSFRFKTKWNSIWFKIERQTVTTIIPIQFERKWKTSFLSVHQPGVQPSERL